jgi:hypothetical protein
MAYLSQHYKIVGASPLICHNGHTRDPLNDFSKALRKVSKKRTKTDADHEEMASIEWYASLYVFGGEPCLASDCWEGVLYEAGKRIRIGKTVQAATIVPEATPLDYEGPRKPDEMWEDGRFKFTKAVRIKNIAVMRTRSIFALPWGCEVHVRYDPQMLDLGQLHQVMQIAGDVGVGDWRPKYGRFEATAL